MEEEYVIIIKPFKTKEEAENTKNNICNNMHMDESVFYIEKLVKRVI